MMEQANRILTFAWKKRGYEAYIIGGAVRDILMHQKPHDFDIVTSARPDTVIGSPRGQDIQTTDLVGKSFGVVVATPRRESNMKLQRIALNDMERIVIDQKKSLMPIPWRKTCCVVTLRSMVWL